MKKICGRPIRPIIVTAIADDADTRLVPGQVFEGGASQFSKVLGYTAGYIRKKLEFAPIPIDARIGDGMGPCTLRGISFQYLENYQQQYGPRLPRNYEH